MTWFGWGGLFVFWGFGGVFGFLGGFFFWVVVFCYHFSWFQKALASYHSEEELESQLLGFALHVKFGGLIVQF